MGISQTQHLLHHFHCLQVNSWTFSILLFAKDPPCLELQAMHQFNVIPFLDHPEIQFLAYHMGISQTQHFLHHFHCLQVNSWTFSILLFAKDPPCLELQAMHQFNVIPFLDQPEIQFLAYHMGISQTQHFLHHFHCLQVNSWTFSILLFAKDPPCLELQAMHQFNVIPFIGSAWNSIFGLSYGDKPNAAFVAPFSLPTSQFLDFFPFFFLQKILLA